MLFLIIPLKLRIVVTRKFAYSEGHVKSPDSYYTPVAMGAVYFLFRGSTVITWLKKKKKKMTTSYLQD